MLIHGAWLTPSVWAQFRSRYEARGFSVLSPAWPLLDGQAEPLRRAPPKSLGRLGVGAIVEAYAAQAAVLSEPPILIGQGFGGLIVQLLLDRGCGACGVAIAPAPPLGVRIPARAVWTTLPTLLAWNGWNRALTLSFERFAANVAQTLPRTEQSSAYAASVAPAPGRIFFQRMLGLASRVNYANPHRPPLLLIAGEKDRTFPFSMVRSNARKQQRAASRTDLQLFTGRSHWLCNEPGWEEVADFALDWALANARPPGAPRET
jgi:pimeloyl-ACP methyl ester carboxylesterase